MLDIVKMLLKLFGIGNGESKINRVGGIINNVAMLPLVAYLVANADKRINFETSLGFLALCVMFLYWHMETLRRSRPGYQSEGYHD